LRPPAYNVQVRDRRFFLPWSNFRMNKTTHCAAAAALLLAAQVLAAPAAGDVLGPQAEHCFAGSGKPAALVRVSGLKNRKGELRVQAYGSDAAKFLEKGEWIARVDLPVTASGPMDVCVPLPRPGNYAIAVRHDANGNGKSDWNDGGGFSRNPDLSLTNLEPDHARVVVPVGNGPAPLSIVMQYRHGLTIRPVR
jgi:uncharacterized protein (DUF2141 family)